MSKEMLDVFVYHVVPMLVFYLIFKDCICIGKYFITIPGEVREDMIRRAEKRNMKYILFVRKALKLALVLERIEYDPQAKVIIKERGKAPQRFRFD